MFFKMNLNELYFPILRKILYYVNPRDILMLRRTCKRLSKLMIEKKEVNIFTISYMREFKISKLFITSRRNMSIPLTLIHILRECQINLFGFIMDNPETCVIKSIIIKTCK